MDLKERRRVLEQLLKNQNAREGHEAAMQVLEAEAQKLQQALAQPTSQATQSAPWGHPVAPVKTSPSVRFGPAAKIEIVPPTAKTKEKSMVSKKGTMIERIVAVIGSKSLTAGEIAVGLRMLNNAANRKKIRGILFHESERKNRRINKDSSVKPARYSVP